MITKYKEFLNENRNVKLFKFPWCEKDVDFYPTTTSFFFCNFLPETLKYNNLEFDNIYNKFEKYKYQKFVAECYVNEIKKEMLKFFIKKNLGIKNIELYGFKGLLENNINNHKRKFELKLCFVVNETFFINMRDIFINEHINQGEYYDRKFFYSHEETLRLLDMTINNLDKYGCDFMLNSLKIPTEFRAIFNLHNGLISFDVPEITKETLLSYNIEPYDFLDNIPNKKILQR